MSRKRRRKKPQKPQTLIDVCIPVHGRFDLLRKCLEYIPDAFGDITYQIYIFDNGSPKEEADLFYPVDRSIKVIRSKENIGFPRACNRMVAAGRSPLIFLLNSDVMLAENSVDLLVREMDNPDVGVVGMRLVFPIEHAGLEPNRRPAGRLQHIGLTTNIRGEVIHPFMAWNPDHPRVMAQREVFAVTGAALMTRRNIWSRLKGFDEMYGQGTFEDADFCMTVRELGYNILVVPEATGVHYTGATVEKYQVGYPVQYNYNQFMQKWNQKVLWWQWRQA